MTIKRPTLADLYGNIVCKCPYCLTKLLENSSSNEWSSVSRYEYQAALRLKREHLKARILTIDALLGAVCGCLLEGDADD